jgi:DNA polymerase III subunit epsilon
MAKDLHPGKRNGLDALCERYQVDNSARTLHGALLDARLLAEVYLCMTRGQESLIMEAEPAAAIGAHEAMQVTLDLIVVPATPDELAAHDRHLEEIDRASAGACLWKRLEA